MENQYLLNPLHFEPSPVSSSMPNWETISSSAMEIQPTVLNCSSDHHIQTHDGFFNPIWDKSTDQALHFDSSALSSIVSSSSPASSNESLIIRELIGKLGTTNEISISPHASFVPPLMNNHLVKENLQNLGGIGKQIPLNSTTEFSADPGFVERAAKFSCFGSRSFNERNGELLAHRSVQVVENGLNRVSSSPSLKNLGSQMENKNCSQLQEQDRMEVTNSQEESTISEQNPNGDLKSTSPDFNSRKRKASSKGKASNKRGEGSEDSNAKRSKVNECDRNENGQVKVEEESKGGTTTSNEEKQNKSNSKPPEAPKDYIHVRARRGQATDSHSLAERVRREKISERMKLLQDLVPGCNKVTGKALMLDEIINYVQSLQRQVEFLSMKLASVNTRMDFSIDSLVSKDIFQSNNNSMAQPIVPIDSSVAAFYGQQNPAIHNNIPNRTVTHCSVDPFDTSLCQNLGVQLPPLNGFNEAASQYPLTFCEDDLHTIVQMGFGQTGNRNTPVQPPTFNGSNQAPQMKVEL